MPERPLRLPRAVRKAVPPPPRPAAGAAVVAVAAVPRVSMAPAAGGAKVSLRGRPAPSAPAGLRAHLSRDRCPRLGWGSRVSTAVGSGRCGEALAGRLGKGPLAPRQP